MSIYPIFIAAIALTTLSVGSASAQSRTYRVDADSTTRINFRLCDARVRIKVAGDRDTDLDFRIVNSTGEQVYRNDDPTDRTSTTIHNGRGCNSYTLYVVNRGDVFNDFRVMMSPVRSSATGSVRY